MTNAQIIFMESIKLMEDGTIGTTGRTFEMEGPNGDRITVQEPEPLHTFKGWKERGYTVRKGEHAKASFPIWTARKGKKGEPEEETAGDDRPEKVSMYLKRAYWFTAAQVEPTKVKKGA